MKRLRTLFFPPGGSKRSWLFWTILIAAVLLVFAVALVPAWEYTNSPAFCGQVCHTMPPEYQLYLVSPHARVLCVDCHIGRGSFFVKLYRKSDHMDLLFKTITGNYEFPIFVSEMRPARETCEECHFPEKFSDDSLRVFRRFENNETNDPYDLYLLMHTGGGTQREGLGFGIHWHTENLVEFITTDRHEQDIPWVRVTTVDGQTSEYISTGSSIDTTNLGQYDIREMDCITCHNRISHLINTPARTVDLAMYRGDISPDILFIRAQAIDLLAERYPSNSAANEAFVGLETYYSETHPAFYSENSSAIRDVISLLEELYQEISYPDQELYWDTHPNNIGHYDWPGCFRCHDGQHVNAQGEVIRLECNLCHSIPLVVRPTDIQPMLPLSTGLEPESHFSTTWIHEHYLQFDASCANCHTTQDMGGTTDVSFCSNSKCHGVDWRYAGFNAPALAAEIGIGPVAMPVPATAIPSEQPVTYAELQPILVAACGQCHGERPTRGLRVTDYVSLMTGGDSGPAIVPGSSADSLFVQKLAAGHFGQLTSEEMILLERWIAAGAPEGEAVPAPEPTEAATGEPVSYHELQPLLAEACGRCHGPTATKGLDVTEYDALMAGGDSGPAIVPGSPADSLLVQKLVAGHFGQLTEQQIALLEQWIAAGAPEG